MISGPPSPGASPDGPPTGPLPSFEPGLPVPTGIGSGENTVGPLPPPYRFGLHRKVCLVTGGESDIGRAVALELAAAGGSVVVQCHGAETVANPVVDQIRRSGGEARMVRGEISSRREVEEMLAQVDLHYPRIDVLVGCARFLTNERFLELREESWDQVLDVNLKGAFLMGQAVARRMVGQGHGGRILNITGSAAAATSASRAHFRAASAGLIGLTQTMARDLASYDITVNTIAAGFIESEGPDMLHAAPDVVRRIPKGRFGRPLDVAALAVYLASDESDYVTGATFVVDGGLAFG